MRRLSSAREAARGAVLAYEAVGAPSSSPHRLVFILHGLLGSGRNWRSFARRLAGATPSLRVVLVDLRGHGHSAALGGAPHTLAAAAADVEATAAVTGAPSVVLGHSLGGKIALAYAARFAAPGSAVWALDSSPGAHAGDPHGVGAVLDVVGRLPAVLPSRAAAHRTLSTAGLSPGLVAWLTSGLVPADGGDGDAPAGPDGPVRFAFAMTTCRALFDDYRATCLWKSLESPPTGVDVRLVAAANSGAWGGEAGERVARLPAAARARVLPLPNAGHWLHVENPEGLHNLLRDHGAAPMDGGAPTTETGAASLMRSLRGRGVSVVFANPGTTAEINRHAEMHLVAALDAVPGFRSVLCLHETVAAGAADGYGRLVGGRAPAACLLHLGPGLANACAALHNARRARSPLLVLVGDMASWMAPADPPLRWGEPVAALAAGATRGWVRACSGAGSLAADAADAVDATSARSGAASRVATLVVPHDAAWGAVPTSLAVAVAPPAAPPPLHPPAPSPSAAAFYAGAAAALSRDGPRAALLLGGDALLLGGGLRAAAAIAAATGCALLCENGFAALDRGAGAPPVARVPYFPRDAVACLSAFATLVLVGAPPPAAMFGYPGEEGRAGAVCALPDEAVWDADGVAPVDALDALAAALGLRAPPPPAPPPQQPPHPPAPLLPDRACALTPALLCTVVAALQPPGCVVVDESLTSGGDYWRLSASAPGFTHLTLTGGAIGSGLPLSVGAALARPGARVLLLQADGSGLYAPQALWTQARERLGVVTLVCSNRRYGILRLEAAIQRTGPQGPAGRSLTDLSGPAIDWCALARGFGVPAADAVATVGELADALGAALAQPGPTLIEVALP